MAGAERKEFPAIVIFADGASSGNPGPSGWGAIIATREGVVTELGGGEPASTNNRMELMGVIEALARLPRTPDAIEVFTDSVYVIKGITQWCWGWMKKGWKTAAGEEVANQDLWKRLIAQVSGRTIRWKFVKGHAGIPGNERVDEIAVAFSKRYRIDLYHGPLLKYPVPIFDIPENTDLPAPKPEREAKPLAFSYLSVVGGVPMRHTTWSDCERRVKGVSGAKFKKSTNEQNEKEILSAWGLSPADLPSNGGK